MKIILGSQSENRKQVFLKAGYVFDVLISNIDEKAIRHEDLYELPLRLAKAKAEALLPRIKEPALLITADVVTIWNGELREKPRDFDEARRFLKSFSESPHPVECVNGIVVTNTATGVSATGNDISKVWFGKIPDEFIETPIGRGNVCGGLEHLLSFLCNEHSWYAEKVPMSVLGMPLNGGGCVKSVE